MVTIDPITGLPDGDDSSQETQSAPLRPQSPLVRGSHLDKSSDRPTKRTNLSSQADNDCMQPPAKRGQLQGSIPPAFKVVHPREKLEHILDAIECVINGDEDAGTADGILASHPLNLEKTRFSMSKKKLKLQFIDDVLDRFEDERWLYPYQFARKRKLWHKSVDRSLNFINKFLDEHPTSGEYVRPHNSDRSFGGETTFGSTSTHASEILKKRGRKKKEDTVAVKPAPVAPAIPMKRGRKKKEDTVAEGLATVAKLTFSAPTEKIPKKSAVKENKALENTTVKKPTFGRKKKEVEKGDDADENGEGKEEKKKREKKKPVSSGGETEPATKKRKKDKIEKEDGETEKNETKTAPTVPKQKKSAFTVKKRGKKGTDEVAPPADTDPVVEDIAMETLPKSQSDGNESEKMITEAVEDAPEKEMEIVRIMSTKKEGNSRKEIEKEEEIKKKLEEYGRIDEEEDEEGGGEMSSQKSMKGGRTSQTISTPVIPRGMDDDMESDNEEWEPNETGRELTPPRGLLPTSVDPLLLQSTPSSIAQSSQSIFGSLNSSQIGSPNTSFSSQSSSLLAPSSIPPFNLSSSLLPSSISLLPQPLATSTQIPQSQVEVKKETNQKMEKSKSGPRVKPTFGKRK